MHVNVERQERPGDRQDVEARHTGFFSSFAESDLFHLRLTIGMPAELQPAVELAMMGKQAAAAVSREDPRRARDVPRPAGSLEAVGVRFDERDDAVDDVRLQRKRVPITLEHVEQRPTVHRRDQELGIGGQEERIIYPTTDG
jgi:hypothetical protein